MKGIITADVVGSTQMDIEVRNALPEILSDLADSLREICPLRLEMYRGDSFQVVVDKYEKSSLVAVLIRIGLMRHSCMANMRKLDARVSVGIGKVSHMADTIGKSDGEAFVLSGRAFDRLGKKRLVVVTPDEKLNDELAVYESILDELLSDVTCARSRTIFAHLLSPAQTMEKIGHSLGMSKQAVSQAYSSTRVAIIDLVLKRIEYVLANNLKK